MGIKCLIKGHDWRFGYNHGMPRRISTEDALKMLHEGTSYGVCICYRCKTQARLTDGVMIKLNKELVQVP